MQSMVGNHGFVDGNKRTALILVITMVERSGYTLVVPENELLDDIVVDVAAGRMTYDQLELWFKARLIPLSDRKSID